MKTKISKQVFAVLLTVVMLVSGLPFAAFAADCTHEFGEWTITKEATCTEKGERTRKCKLCNANNIQTIDATGHDFSTTKKVVQAATCKADGYKAIVCTKCLAEKEGTKEVLPKLTHEWVNNTNAAFLKSEANCKTPATYYKSCKKCQEKSTETFTDGTTAPAKHSELVPLGKDKPATCAEKGYDSGKKCKDCGIIVSMPKELPKIPHTPGKPATCTTKAVCSACGLEYGELNPENHKEIKTDAAEAATCTVTGKTEGKHCEACKAVITAQEAVAPLGHDHGEAINNKDATHSFRCMRCNEVVDETFCVDADKNCVCDVCKYQYTHVYLTYVSDNNATCVQDGTETAKCDICGIATDTILDVGSHHIGSHNYTYTTAKYETCTTDRVETGTCSLCGKLDTRIVLDTKLGHDESEWKLPEGFDCTIGGIKKTFCRRCGDVVNSEAISPKAHEEKVSISVEATCTTDGKAQGLHCGYCEKIIIPQETIPALGHESVDGVFVQIKAPDCENAGEKESTCKRCNQRFTALIPANGHKYISNTIMHTCTKDGYTEYECIVCHKGYSDNIVKAHHTDENMDYLCDVCNKDLRTVIAQGNCGANGDNVTFVFYDNYELEIRGVGNMANYSDSSPDSWGPDAWKIWKVTVGYGITSIGDETFKWLESLTNITIPNSVTTIGEGAFFGCYSLTDIVIPDSVTSIGAGAFCDCSGLESVVIPEGVTSIDYNAFFNCPKLTSVTIPKSVTNIDYTAFGYYTKYGLSKVRNFKICCYADSEGLNYALENKFDYELLDEPTPHTHTLKTEEVAPTCTAEGIRKIYCTECQEVIGNEILPATGHHADNDHNGRCDTCDKDTTQGCDCRCHKDGFQGFIYKIVRIFWKLFKTNQICNCGVSHY